MSIIHEMSAKTRSSHDAAVVVAIIVVAAATAVTCLHININSEVQTMMKKNLLALLQTKIETQLKLGQSTSLGSSSASLYSSSSAWYLFLQSIWWQILLIHYSTQHILFSSQWISNYFYFSLRRWSFSLWWAFIALRASIFALRRKIAMDSLSNLYFCKYPL